jgi:hypothetical protein
MRYDIYGRAHKALRAVMADTLVALGRMDSGDECEVRETHARLEEMLAFCEHHAAIENEHLHREIEARRSESSCAFALAHHEQEAEVETLRGLAAERSPLLYRRVASFIAANLAHMEDEESRGNELLWELFTDEELQALEKRIVATRPPGQAMQALRWMLPSISHPQRVVMLGNMRSAPPAVFDAAVAVARAHLRAADFVKLEAELALG